MESKALVQYLLNFDVVWLSEVKVAFEVQAPGFKSFRTNSSEKNTRGGVVILIKNHLVKEISNISINNEGFIWVEFITWKNYTFGGGYIPPSDSKYFDDCLFGEIQGKIIEKTQKDKKVIVLGDLNARVWDATKLAVLTPDSKWRYVNCKDSGVNQNGKKLLNLCQGTDSVILNNLHSDQTNFSGDLSFRKKNRWVSEIDLGVANLKALDSIDSFSVNQTEPLPSDHASIELCVKNENVSIEMQSLLQRSADLGSITDATEISHRRSLPSHQIDKRKFIETISASNIPVLDLSLENHLSWFSETVQQSTMAARMHNDDVQRDNDEWDRWKKLLTSRDAKAVWHAIDWSGKLKEDHEEKPNESDFKIHFENLLNPTAQDLPREFNDSPYIPVLDDPITPIEVESVIKNSKLTSYKGLCPGLLKWMPMTFIVYITFIFNVVFLCNEYPEEWCISNLITLFKKGDRLCCGNYRGISVMDTLAKIYDSVLNDRLRKWLRVDVAQAGAQKHRSCTEHILALRLLMDYCFGKKRTLYVVFVDFQKAYDKVPRHKLIECLKERGCGKVMIQALRNLYQNTSMLLNDMKIDSSIGVRQGAPTSCLLFILYIDCLVKKLMSNVPDDGFLGSMHCMLFMDDAVLLATSREKCLEKMKVLMEFCAEYGMSVNASKTQFMVVGKKESDVAPLRVQDIEVGYTNQYVYLGEHFVDDAKISSVFSNREIYFQRHLNKLSICLQKNSSMPFPLKKKLLEACFMAAMLYGSESWLTNNLAKVEKYYHAAVKMVLAVRVSTPNVLCLLEIGLPDLASYILERRAAFMSRMSKSLSRDEPFWKVYELCTRESTPGSRFLQSASNYDGNIMTDARSKLQQLCRNRALLATKFATYNFLNVNLEVHPMYTQRMYVFEQYRKAFTRFRLSSHDLKIETGRWSRIPRNERFCVCSDVVQDEFHVLFLCPNTSQIRSGIPCLFENENNFEFFFQQECNAVAKTIHNVLNAYM